MNSQEQTERLGAIVAMLDENMESGRDANRRRQARIPVRLPLVVALLTSAGAIPVDAFMRNISLSGIGFISRRMFNADERVAVFLEMPKIPPKLVLARITFARYVRSGLFETGAEFLQCVVLRSGEALSRSPISRIPSQWLSTVRQAQTAAASAKAAADAVKAALAGTLDTSVTSGAPGKSPAVTSAARGES